MCGKGGQTAIPLDDGIVYALSVEIASALHFQNIKRSQVRVQLVTVQLLFPRHMCQGREHNSKRAQKHSQQAHSTASFRTPSGEPKRESKQVHPQEAFACQQLSENWCDDNCSGGVHLAVSCKFEDAPPVHQSELGDLQIRATGILRVVFRPSRNLSKLSRKPCLAMSYAFLGTPSHYIPKDKHAETKAHSDDLVFRFRFRL